MLRKFLTSAFFLAVGAWAQTPAPAPDPTSAPLPSHWLGISASYNPSQHPRVAGGFSMANLLGNSMYSFTTADLTVVKGNLVSSTRTGIALIHPLYEDRLYLGVFGNVGAATTGKNASFSTAGGGLLFYRWGKAKNYDVWGGFHVLDTGAIGGLVNVPEGGFGFTF